MRAFLDDHGRLVLAAVAAGVLLLRCSGSPDTEEPAPRPPAAAVPPAAGAPLDDCSEAKRTLKAANGVMAYVFSHSLPDPAPSVGDAAERVSVTTERAPQDQQDDARVVVAGLTSFEAAVRLAGTDPAAGERALADARSAVEDPQYASASVRLSSWWEEGCVAAQEQESPS